MNPSASYYNNNVDALVKSGPCELLGVVLTDVDAGSLSIHNCTSSPSTANKVLEVNVATTVPTQVVMLAAPITLSAGLYVDVGTAIAGSYCIIWR